MCAADCAFRGFCSASLSVQVLPVRAGLPSLDATLPCFRDGTTSRVQYLVGEIRRFTSDPSPIQNQTEVLLV